NREVDGGRDARSRQRRAVLDRGGALAGDRRTPVGRLHRGAGGGGRPDPLPDRSAAVRGGAAAGRGGARAQPRAGRRHLDSGRAGPTAARAEPALAVGVRSGVDRAGRLSRGGRGRRGAAREREAAAAVHDDRGARGRPHRCAARAPRIARAAERHDAYRGDHPGRAGAGVLRVCRAAGAGTSARYIARGAARAGGNAPLLVHGGSLVRPNSTTPLVVINRVAPALVSFAVPARLLPVLRRDQSRGSLRVLAVPSGSAEAALTGTLDFVDNAVDPAT